MTATTPSRLAGHVLVEALIAQGVDTAFGVPGESYLAVLDGFYEHRERIRFIACRQEGGAAFMAEAQGKLTGRPGICFVTRGPGATNASIGLHTAFQDSTPMVLFIGQVASDQRDREAFQELDYRQVFGPGTLGFAKWVGEVHDPARLPEYVARAFHTAMQGRPGPVVLVLPEDMLSAATTAAVLPRVEPALAWPAPGALREVRTMLLAAAKPFVIVGGSGWDAGAVAAMQRFAEAWQLPVGCAFRFQDLFDNAHPNYAGDVGIGINPKLAARIKEADLILAVGPRLGEMTTGRFQASAKRCIASTAPASQPLPPTITKGLEAASSIVRTSRNAPGAGHASAGSTRGSTAASVTLLSMSSGSTSTTGPGRPCIAVRNARATYSGRRAGSCTSPTHFAKPSVPGPNIWR